jgi:hypothetical protein
MNYEEALHIIQQGPSTGKAARRKSWDDGEACIWWDGQHIQYSRFKSRGVGWTLTAQDKKASDWITQKDGVDWGKEARKLVMTDDLEEIRRLEGLLDATREEVVNQFIEDPPWASRSPELVGGKGTPQERLAAVRKTYPDWATEEP